jgi:type IV pilus assembly protein PilM
MEWLSGGGARRPLGIDLGTNGIKAVSMRRKGRRAVITGVYTAAIPRETAARPSLETLSAAVAALLKEHRIRADRFVSAFPLYSALVRTTVVPFRGTGKIRQVIRFQAEPLIPFPIEEMLVDFHETRAAEENRTPVLIIAAKKELVARHIQILTDGGIDPEIVGLDALALANNYLLRAGNAPADELAMLVDIGATKTVLVIVRGGTVLLARNINVGGDDVTEAIQKECGIDFPAAEALKRERGSALPGGESPPGEAAPGEAALHKAIGPVLTRLNREIDRSLRSISATLTGSTVSRVLLSGGGALLRGARELFAKEFNCRAEFLSSLSPFAGSPPDEEMCPAAVAAGLAVQGLGLEKAQVNLRREEFSWGGGLGRAGRPLAVAAVLLLLLAGVAGWRFAASFTAVRQEHAALADELERIYRETFPDGATVEPAAVASEMEKRIGQYREAHKSFFSLASTGVSSLEILREISERIPPDLKARITDLTIGQEEVEMTGLIDNAGDADKIKMALKTSPYFESVDVPSTTASGAKQKFKLKATIRKAAAR